VNIKIGQYTIRDWVSGDEAALVKYADNRRVWINLDDIFPHPYTAADARAWIEVSAWKPVTNFAIATDEEAIGGIGLKLKKDVYRRSAEVGYWLGEPFWGRGIATAALKGIADLAFREFDLVRLDSHVFDGNTRSAHVLEKNGFRLEGRLVKSVTKDGRTFDSLLYALTRDGP
jgi:ribosomal-protein-alanine N-acetyltransferase